jgi:hypothetical protein
VVAASTYSTDVLRAELGPDGTLSAWQPQTPLASPSARGAAVVFGSSFAVLGGDTGTANSSKVSIAPVLADGALGAWQPALDFPTARYRHDAVVHAGFLYVVGGKTGGTTFKDVQFTTARADGTMSPWTRGPDLPDARSSLSLVATGSTLYAVGGEDAAATPQATVYASALGTDGTPGPWTTGALPASMSAGCALVIADRLYTVGGLGASSSAVRFAPVLSDGSLGAWTDTTPLVNQRFLHRCVFARGFLFALGGLDDVGAPLASVEAAPVQPNGVVGNWQAVTPLPAPRSAHVAVAR